MPRRVALAENVADTIAWAISIGTLKPLEKLQEGRLASQTGVSRLPIREALKILHAQGIVTSEQNHGYRVAQFDAKTVADVLAVRLSLESILLRDAVANWRAAGNTEASPLEEPLQAMRLAAKADDRVSSLAADLSFHRAIATAASNEICRVLWEGIARHTLIIFNRREYRDDSLTSVVVQHDAFRSAIRKMIQHNASEETIRLCLEDHLLVVARDRLTSH